MDENLSWARKYRPKNLEDVSGNTRLKKEVETLISMGKFPQTVLLEGVQGTGKTTMARLIAKSLLCTESQEGKACGNCYSCKRLTDDYITKGQVPTDISVFDYNISKLNRTEDTELIVENMQGRNFDGSKRVFILDEIQVASQQAQTRFLRVAEEPMENLFIIMCTTNPEKLLKPLKSRFINYKLKKPTTLELTNLLENICVSEGVNYAKSGLSLIVNKMNRNPREILNRAELISNTGDLSRKVVSENLDIIAEDMYVDFLKACKTSNLANIAKICTDLEENNIEFKDFSRGFGEFLANLIDITSLVKIDIYSEQEIKKYKRIAKDISDPQMVGLLKLTKEQYKVSESERFLIYSYATELMSLFNASSEDESRNTTIQENLVVSSESIVTDSVPEIDKVLANQNYEKLSKELQEAESEGKEIKRVDKNGLLDIFNGLNVNM